MKDLRTHLEYQADRVEAVLAAHRTPVRVCGGTVGPRLIRFFLTLAPQVRLSNLTALTNEVALALQVQAVTIKRGQDGVILEFPNPDPQTVKLLPLLREVQPLPMGALLLGMQADGVPLLARLQSPDVAHILIAGTTGSGKSVLLRSIAASLMLNNDPANLSILAIDPKGRTFPAGFTCRHLLRGHVITDPQTAKEALASVVKLMEVRDKRRESVPLIVVLIDELADLVMTGDGIETHLVRIAQRGREAGIHLVAATQRPSAAVLSGLMRANFPLRLVGRVISPEDARIAAGRGGTAADKLSGRGDFLAVGGDMLRFQVAYLDAAELQAQVMTGAPAFALPVIEETEPEPPHDDIDILATRLAPWWNRNKQRFIDGERGVQKEAISVLFPNDPLARNAGAWREYMFAAVDRVENSTTTGFLPSDL